MSYQQGSQPQWQPQQSQQPPAYEQPPYGQPQMGQQPQTGYGQPQWQPQQPQQPMYQPQQPMISPPTPKKKSRKGLWIGLAVVIILLVIIVAITSHGGSSSSPTSNTTTSNTTTSNTSNSTSSSKWTTTHTFNGNGQKKTAVFAVPNDWKIVWTCNGQNIDGVTADGVLAVIVYNSDNTIADPAAVNATCKAGSKPTSDLSEEHQSGNVYLDVNATGNWTIQIQELK